MVTTGLRTFVDGNASGPTIVFVHGWPDDHTMWDKQVAHLKNRYRCVTTDLPGFSVDGVDDAHTEKWGYSFDTVVKRLENTIEVVGGGEPVHLVAHDWGCVYAFLLEKKRPDLVSKMVALDVGGKFENRLSLGLLAIASYQMFLIAAFLIGGPVGNAMARAFARSVGAPSASRVASARVCYPYYHFWKQQLLGEKRDRIGGMMPQAPLLFVYGIAGVKRWLTFHSQDWAAKVEKKAGSASVELPGAGHWVTEDRPDDVNRQLEDFFAEK